MKFFGPSDELHFDGIRDKRGPIQSYEDYNYLCGHPW